MLITRFIVVLLIGILVVLGACSKPPPKPMEPAAFIVSDLVIAKRLDQSDQSRVFVTVTNTGEQTGTYKVTMTVDNQINPVVITTKDVTVVGGDSTTVTFLLYGKRQGLYKITVDNLYAEYYEEVNSGG